MKAKVVFKGTSKKGKKFIIRYPNNSDAPAMTHYINALSREKTFIRFQGEQVALDSEQAFLNERLNKIEKKESIMLIAVIDNGIVGISGIDLKDKTESHEGVFGISVAASFRGEGIGKILMETTLSEAEKEIPKLRIITLGVFANNDLAYSIYEKFGFKEFGRLPEGLLHRGQYVDHIYMYKKIR